MRAATVVQALQDLTCFKFYCMFYLTCDRSLSANSVHTADDDSALCISIGLYIQHSATSAKAAAELKAARKISKYAHADLPDF